MADKSSKTEKPSPKKLQKARKEGQLARSQDPVSWIGMLAATWLLEWIVRGAGRQGRELLSSISDVAAQGGAGLLPHLEATLLSAGLLVLPFAAVFMVIGVGGQMAQIGWAPKPLKPRLGKLNPLKGLKGLFGGGQLAWMLVKNLTALGIVAAFSASAAEDLFALLLAAPGTHTAAAAATIGSAALAFMRSAAIAGLVLALADYAMTRRRVMGDLRMTKQEVKDEHRQSEGDPQVKSQLRSRQLAMSRNRMIASVPQADVVLVNPTHVAVALRYDATRGAPTLVAKGAGAIAARIREVAAEHRVPIVRDVLLARTIYRLVEVDSFIPVELYEAVAKVLAFIYTLKAKGRSRAGVLEMR